MTELLLTPGAPETVQDLALEKESVLEMVLETVMEMVREPESARASEWVQELVCRSHLA